MIWSSTEIIIKILEPFVQGASRRVWCTVYVTPVLGVGNVTYGARNPRRVQGGRRMSAKIAVLGLVIEEPGPPIGLTAKLRQRLSSAGFVDSNVYSALTRLERDGLVRAVARRGGSRERWHKGVLRRGRRCRWAEGSRQATAGGCGQAGVVATRCEQSARGASKPVRGCRAPPHGGPRAPARIRAPSKRRPPACGTSRSGCSARPRRRRCATSCT